MRQRRGRTQTDVACKGATSWSQRRRGQTRRSDEGVRPRAESTKDAAPLTSRGLVQRATYGRAQNMR
eukprot:5913867-Pleurochrysis_carterae.AAC.3